MLAKLVSGLSLRIALASSVISGGISSKTADATVPLSNLTNLQLIGPDANLPGRLDGIDLASSARKAHPRIPVIFISGRAAQLADAHVLGDPVLYLQKPFSVRALLSDIKRLIGH